jgi:D-alanine-D-alanine ligase
MKKIKVAVLMGGKSPEYEISLISGQEVVRNLDKSKYQALPVVISRDGSKWRLTDAKGALALPDPLAAKKESAEIIPASYKEISGAGGIAQGVGVAFIAMHGPFGEDGTIQGLLEMAGIKYTGSKVLASALGMDKIKFREILKGRNLPVPKYLVVKKGERLQNLNSLGKPPYFVKPYDLGSSVGASIARNKKELAKSLKLAFKYSSIALVDEYLKGKELTVSVIGNEKPQALPVIEIKPLKADFFDYQSKYSESGAEEIVPAQISKQLTKKVQLLAIEVYKAIGARGFGRVDFILKNNKSPYVLEINSIPGLTPMSLLPKAAKSAGISYSSLLDKIIRYALEK